MRVLVLTGSGRLADPWHPFAATSAAIARVAEEAGFATTIAPDPIARLAVLGRAAAQTRGGTSEHAAVGTAMRAAEVDPGDGPDPVATDPSPSSPPLDDLAAIVVDAGDHLTPLPEGVADPGAPSPQLLEAAAAGLRAALDAGVGLLGVHAAASTLREVPGFGEALGARWERDESWHPPFGRLRVEPAPAAPSRLEVPVPSELREPVVVPEPFEVRERFVVPEPFEVLDERYTALRFADDAVTVARAVDADGVHPLVTARREGPARVVYSALGHDERSYTSAAHRALLASALHWIARR
ncbi:ThuA domain-containing protein [Arenivirga flava]|uniref:ThuA-like domain-containing protein n=1 Tax=Arenivirga flava TaxID=1930060 RepID=A0AA37UGH5_9MICO|nr:ThuA domain-containing protein [Arenivirga flava]GMA28489.1 hypothetical protein GCM10025874_17420 [Arenivirga flava]